MVRKLAETDRELTLEFLSEEPSINLFIIGDIEAYGFEEDFQEIWGQFNLRGEIEGVLLRYHESFIAYWKNNDFDSREFKEIILYYKDNIIKGKIIISGKESITKSFDNILPNYKGSSMYFCELTDKNKLCQVRDEIKIAITADAERIFNFIVEIEEFSNAVTSVERTERKIREKNGRVYFIENEAGEIVSICQTSAENSKSAMIVGVATKKAYRGQGLMSQCLSKLCADVLDEGKTLCLFYDNPKAGSVYHKQGFETIENWMMITEGK